MVDIPVTATTQINVTINSPISIPISKNKNFSLNLNVYRNTHYQTLNKAKRLYEACIIDELESRPRLLCINQCRLIFTLFTGSKRTCDVSNVCSIVDKFFCDTLVKLHILEDDNYNYISDISYRFGGIDKNRPRVEIQIIGQGKVL